MKQFLLPVLGSSLLLISACGTVDGGPGTISTTAPSSMEANFSIGDGVIPFPNNILFSGSLDGTLNFKDDAGAAITDITDPKGAMNQLDGFSAVAPMATTFSEDIDAATLAAGVRVFEVTTAGPLNSYAVTDVYSELTAGVHYVAIPAPTDAKALVIKPIVPLKSNTNYMVVITNALKSTSGNAVRAAVGFKIFKGTDPLVNASGGSLVPGRDDATAQTLEGLRQLTQAMLGVAGAQSIAAADVALIWSFKTQTLGTVLAKIQADSATDPYASDVANFLFEPTAATFGVNGRGTADFYTFAQILAAGGNSALLDAYGSSPTNFDTIGSVISGAVKLPYYLDDNTVVGAPLTSTFQLDSYGAPIIKSIQTVPFLMTIPKGAAPAALGGKWPVVIFQHGFTVDKSVVFGIANSLSVAGFATISMDAVLHGDRTFGVDFVTQAVDANGRSQTTAAAPDNIADSSGTHYLNLTSLLTSRDNIRQSVASLIHLTRLLELITMDVVDNNTGLPLNGAAADGADLIIGAAPISYVGHSNGGILGGVLAGVEPAIKTFVLVNPGGDYASILQNSLAYGPIVNAGLEAKGVAVGSKDYNSFFVAAQTIVDDGDPLNYAAAAVAAGKSILVMKTLDDGVVPNPQTDSLSLALGLKQVALDTAGSVWPLGAEDGTATPGAPLPSGGFTGSGFTFFTQGTHSSILKPDPADATGIDVIAEMQTQVLYYLVSGLQPAVGATVYIGASGALLPSGNATSTVIQ